MADHELAFTSCISLAPGLYCIRAGCSCEASTYETKTTAGTKSGRQNIIKKHARHVAEKAGETG